MRVQVGRAGHDHADARAVVLDDVERRGLGIFYQIQVTLLHHHVLADGHGGHHDVLGNALFVGLDRDLLALADLYGILRVRDTGGKAQQHGGVKLLGEVKCQLGELQAFRGVRGLQHGQLGGLCIVAGILLVLRGMHAGVVCYGNHKACVHARVGCGKEGVGHDVQANVLTAGHGAAAADRCADGNLGSHLFIGSPLDVDLGVLHNIFGNLGAGSAGVRGYHAHARLICAACNGRISEHKLFGHM